MSEKELLYYLDAYYHENSIIGILNETVNKLSDSNLIDFINTEIDIHNENKDSLIKMMRRKSDE